MRDRQSSRRAARKYAKWLGNDRARAGRLHAGVTGRVTGRDAPVSFFGRPGSCQKMERREAFTQLVRRFQDLAFACAYAALGNVSMAEEAAQEAFLTAWERLDQLRDAAAFPG